MRRFVDADGEQQDHNLEEMVDNVKVPNIMTFFRYYHAAERSIGWCHRRNIADISRLLTHLNVSW